MGIKRYGICTDINEKLIYFSKKDTLDLYKQELEKATIQLNDFFTSFLDNSIEEPVINRIYKEMLAEYERIYHLTKACDIRYTKL